MKNSRTPRPPIISLTGHAMPGDRERFLAAGMDDCLTKPLNMLQVRDAVSRILSRPSPTPSGTRETERETGSTGDSSEQGVKLQPGE